MDLTETEETGGRGGTHLVKDRLCPLAPDDNLDAPLLLALARVVRVRMEGRLDLLGRVEREGREEIEVGRRQVRTCLA